MAQSVLIKNIIFKTLAALSLASLPIFSMESHLFNHCDQYIETFERKYRILDPDYILKHIVLLVQKSANKEEVETYFSYLKKDLLGINRVSLSDIKLNNQTLLGRACELKLQEEAILILTIAQSDSVELNSLLKQESYYKANQKAWATPLHWASFYKLSKLVAWILENVDQITIEEIFNIWASNGANPLQIAIQNADSDMIELFLKSSKDKWKLVSAQHKHGSNALGVAIIINNLKIIELILAEFPGKEYELIMLGPKNAFDCIKGSQLRISDLLNGIRLKHCLVSKIDGLMSGFSNLLSFNGDQVNDDAILMTALNSDYNAKNSR